MKILSKEIEFKTKEIFEFIDITDKIKNFVKESEIKNGIINVFIMHTSAALIANENEPLLIEDFKKSLEKTAPKNDQYKHDNMEIRTVNVCKDECINGHSHCKAIHLLANVVLNVIGKKLQLGQWQSIILVELDRPRQRKIQMQIIGE